jgi:hypothetical protein
MKIREKAGIAPPQPAAVAQAGEDSNVEKLPARKRG